MEKRNKKIKYKVDNAVIMAAGMARRFAPISDVTPKALLCVKGEILIERQIRQLQEAGVPEIVVVVGYKKEQFDYLQKKFGVKLVENKEYLTRNNHGSIYAAREYLKNTYVCSADNYFTENLFEESYYAAVYAEGKTKEWCIQTDETGYISRVDIGGADAWYMLGHTFWSEDFSRKFIEILTRIYNLPQTKDLLWEAIFAQHLDELKMQMRKYSDDIIWEFDSLDELRQFDKECIY